MQQQSSNSIAIFGSSNPAIHGLCVKHSTAIWLHHVRTIIIHGKNIQKQKLYIVWHCTASATIPAKGVFLHVQKSVRTSISFSGDPLGISHTNTWVDYPVTCTMSLAWKRLDYRESYMYMYVPKLSQVPSNEGPTMSLHMYTAVSHGRISWKIELPKNCSLKVIQTPFPPIDAWIFFSRTASKVFMK